MKSRPILFTAPMVRAILDGRKTQTRRIVKPQPPRLCEYGINGAESHAVCSAIANPSVLVPPTPTSKDHLLPCPYGKPGDRLWVKETWKPDPSWGQSSSPTMEIQEGSNILYRSTLPEGHAKHGFGKWRPSIFMRRWMSRITFELVAVRVERLQAITESDAEREGMNYPATSGENRKEAQQRMISKKEAAYKPSVLAYRDLWQSINGQGSWDANPWVWVIEFRKL